MDITSYKVKSGDTLTSIAKTHNTTATDVKRVNNLKTDTIKVGQVLQLPPPKSAPVYNGSAPRPPFIIAKSVNRLFGADSKHSTGQKLPDVYYTKNGALYNLSKQQLGDELISLMEWGSTNSHGIFETKYENIAKDMANAFLKNHSYSLYNTYNITDPSFILDIRKSIAFSGYRDYVELQIKEALKRDNYQILNNRLIIPSELPKTFHFQDGLKGGAINLYKNYWNTGFIIAIDQVSYIEVQLDKIEYKNNIPSKLYTTFILYDTYGLDMEDMKKFGTLKSVNPMMFDKKYRKSYLETEIEKVNNGRNPKQKLISEFFGYYFSCWWTLQYYHNCVPLLVKIKVHGVEISI